MKFTEGAILVGFRRLVVAVLLPNLFYLPVWLVYGDHHRLGQTISQLPGKMRPQSFNDETWSKHQSRGRWFCVTRVEIYLESGMKPLSVESNIKTFTSQRFTFSKFPSIINFLSAVRYFHQIIDILLLKKAQSQSLLAMPAYARIFLLFYRKVVWQNVVGSGYHHLQYCES